MIDPAPLFRRWFRTWKVARAAPRVTVRFSPRLRTSVARCTLSRLEIRLHPALQHAPPAVATEVLCHEAAHLAVYLLHGPGCRPHGPEWQALVRRAGFSPSVRVGFALPRPGRERARGATLQYVHRCPVCGMQRTARRPVPAWRCADCVAAGLEGRLEISSQPARGSGGR